MVKWLIEPKLSDAERVLEAFFVDNIRKDELYGDGVLDTSCSQYCFRVRQVCERLEDVLKGDGYDA